MEHKSFKNQLSFDLNIGYPVNNVYSRDVVLLISNSVAEEVFTAKIPEKPFTWIAQAISIATATIGGVEVGAECRSQYLKNKSFTIPKVILDMPFADGNSMLLEIHRRVWEDVIPRQEIACKYCTKRFTDDIDLSRICLSEETIEKIMENPEWAGLMCDLDDGFTFADFIARMGSNGKIKEKFEAYADIKYNRVLFRIPTMRDAIKHEAYANKQIDFWRRVGFDCIIALQEVDEKGDVVSSFPIDELAWVGLKIYDLMTAPDLKKMRSTLIDELPTTPFRYLDTCPCDLKRDIPKAMEVSRFFSV